MVLKESVFLVNVLCSLVPCDIKHPYPDTSKDPDALKQHFKIEYNGPVNSHAQNHHFYSGHPIVWTRGGKIEGYFMKVVSGRKIFAFEGIPYAEPPVGQLRFRSPVPKQPWDGLYQADEKASDCIQYNMVRLNRLFGDEDCLYLNVYTPYIPNQGLNISKIPVLVWFHDGGFLQGSGSDAGPSYLLQNDVILVTINYRLGVLGFLSTGDAVSPGNYGLKDQVLALEWVNQNIEAFSGDPLRVTLMGHGSGGANVHLQMISPRARNLFSSAISISGTAFNYWSLHSTDEAKNLTHYYGKMIDCPVHNGSQVLVQCLRERDALELVQFQIPLLDDWFAPIILFRPTIEVADYQVDLPFLTETPEEAYNKNSVAKVPYIASITADEGLTYLLLHAVVGSIKMLRSNWDELAPDFLDYENFDVDIHEITRRVTWFYLKEVNAQKAPLSTFAEMIRDRFILGGVHKALQAHCQIAPTYSYVFNYKGQYNLGTSVGYKPHEWGVGHGEDVYYIVNSTLKYDGFQRKDPEIILSKIMVNLISNFAHKGEPIFTTDIGQNIRIWEPITDPKNISMLLIDKVIKMIPEPFIKNIHFWESLGLPDSQPLNFGNANPALKHFGYGIVNNDINQPDPQGLVPPPPLSPPDNNNVNYNYNGQRNAPDENLGGNDAENLISGENPQFKIPGATNNANLHSYTNVNLNSEDEGTNSLGNEENARIFEKYQNQLNNEKIQYNNPNLNIPQQREHNGNYNNPNIPLSEGDEGNLNTNPDVPPAEENLNTNPNIPPAEENLNTNPNIPPAEGNLNNPISNFLPEHNNNPNFDGPQNDNESNKILRSNDENNNEYNNPNQELQDDTDNNIVNDEQTSDNENPNLLLNNNATPDITPSPPDEYLNNNNPNQQINVEEQDNSNPNSNIPEDGINGGAGITIGDRDEGTAVEGETAANIPLTSTPYTSINEDENYEKSENERGLSDYNDLVPPTPQEIQKLGNNSLNQDVSALSPGTNTNELSNSFTEFEESDTPNIS